MKNLSLRALAAALIFITSPGAIAQTTTTFSYTGGMQTYTVPAGVTLLSVTCKGAEGGAGIGVGGGAAGGTGSVVSGALSVTPGTILYLFVGGAGTPYSAGFNGGGNNSTGGGGGGGATDIRIGATATSNRVMIAAGGGGGGGGALVAYDGGKGGGLVGEDGYPALTLGGKGGSQAIGGQGGSAALCGGTGSAGTAGSYGQGANGVGSSGGGGGGFYGGGSGGNNSGGSCNNGAGGGGGGSSNISTSVVSNASISQGGNTGNGSITIIAPGAPVVTTISSSGVTASTVSLTGLVADNGVNTTMGFEYSNQPGLSGIVTTVTSTPSSIAAGAGATAISASVTGLSANTTYYYRAKGTNSVGTTYGTILTFTTQNNIPAFVSGKNQTMSVCRNATSYTFTSQLHVADPDPSQTLTWSVAKAPNHAGTIGGLAPVSTAPSGNINISPSAAITYTPPSGFSGTELFSIQVSDGKSNDTTNFTVTINALPTPVISASGLNLTTTVSFNSYQWYKNNTAMVGATAATYIIPENGDYFVQVTDNNGCTGSSNVYKYPPVSVREVNALAENISLYPNPASSVVHIMTPVAVNAAITTPDGRTVVYKTSAKDVDISGLIPGIYFIRLTATNGTLLKVEKLVKQAQ